MKKEFVIELRNLCDKYGLCVVPEENDRYDIPLVVAPYEGKNTSLYDYLEYTDYENNSHHSIDDEISDEMLESCKKDGVRVAAVDMVWDDKIQNFVEVRHERLA